MSSIIRFILTINAIILNIEYFYYKISLLHSKIIVIDMNENKDFNNDEMIKRLLTLRSKVFKAKDENKILKKLDSEKPSLFAYIELICLLINDKSKVTRTFWDAFVHAQSFFLQLNPVFDIKQISELLQITQNHHTKVNTDESEKLLDDLKQFIAVNGLVQKVSKEHITNRESVNAGKGAIAISQIDEKYKTILIDTYKQILLDGILCIHGISPSRFPNYDFQHALEPKVEIREAISRHKLIKNLDILDDKESEAITKYKAQSKVTTHEEFLFSYHRPTDEEWDEFSKDLDPNESQHWDSELRGPMMSLYKKSGTLSFFNQNTFNCIRKISLFKNLLNDFENRSSESSERLKFENFLKTSADSLDCDMPKDFHQKISHSLEIFSLILNARLSLEETQLYYEERVIGPYGTEEESWQDVGEYPPNLQITIDELTYIAMSKESKSIRNEIIKEDSILKKGSNPNCVTIYSARSWLNDSKRKYPFFELIDIEYLTEKKITIETLKNLNIAK